MAVGDARSMVMIFLAVKIDIGEGDAAACSPRKPFAMLSFTPPSARAGSTASAMKGAAAETAAAPCRNWRRDGQAND
ncbi:MAG: hypothetical protein ACK4UO_15195 [Pseudolabrys sp.]